MSKLAKALRPVKRNTTKIFRGFKEPVWKPYLQQLTDTSVVVQWATNRKGCPKVEFFSEVDKCRTVEGVSKTLDYRLSPWYAQGIQLHQVKLTDLKPNTIYSYKIYIDAKWLCSDQNFSFQTAPTINSNAPFTFITFGDYGNGSQAQKRLRDQMLADSFDFILTVGDNSQNLGTYEQFDYTVFQLYEDIFCRAGLFTAMGNHDYETNQGQPYLNLFNLPGNAWHSEDQQRYYSFDYGNAHFTVLDSNAPLDVDNSEINNSMLHWLDDDLRHTSQQWKIVVCHHPPYNAGDHGPDQRVQAKVIPILETYGVQLVLSGHQHNYQRSKPLRAGQPTSLNKGGIVYIVSGAGAAAKHACTPADWLDFYISSVTYGLYHRVTITKDNLAIEAVDGNGKVKDSYIISTTQTPRPVSFAQELP